MFVATLLQNFREHWKSHDLPPVFQQMKPYDNQLDLDVSRLLFTPRKEESKYFFDLKTTFSSDMEFQKNFNQHMIPALTCIDAQLDLFGLNDPDVFFMVELDSAHLLEQQKVTPGVGLQWGTVTLPFLDVRVGVFSEARKDEIRVTFHAFFHIFKISYHEKQN